jgi:hypothetical protein
MRTFYGKLTLCVTSKHNCSDPSTNSDRNQRQIMPMNWYFLDSFRKKNTSDISKNQVQCQKRGASAGSEVQQMYITPESGIQN